MRWLLLVFFLCLLIGLVGCFRGCGHGSHDEDVEDGALEDNSMKAPKSIKSTELVRFQADINLAHMELEKTDQGAHFIIRNSDRGIDLKGDVPASVLDDLEKLVRTENIARFNGHYKRNTALGENFKVRIDYASGERISFAGEGGEAVVPDGWSTAWCLDFFRNLALANGMKCPKILLNWDEEDVIEEEEPEPVEESGEEPGGEAAGEPGDAANQAENPDSQSDAGGESGEPGADVEAKPAE